MRGNKPSNTNINTSKFPKSNSLFGELFIYLSGITILAVADWLVWQFPLLGEALPSLSWSAILRSGGILLLLAFLMTYFYSNREKKTAVFDLGHKTSFKTLSFGACVSASVFLVFVFLLKPMYFNNFSREDQIVEWSSAILLFASTVLLLITFFSTKNKDQYTALIRYTLLFLAFGFFITGMEEVSWFQRTLDIETPEAFSGNLQNEMNLHNFATTYVENIYYFGSFIFLVLLPFLGFLNSSNAKNTGLSLILPKPYIVLIGAIACVYNYDMWNIIFLQIAFFSSVLIIIFLYFLSKNTFEKYVTAGFILVMIVSQCIFLTHSENYKRIWEITEYKEFFIPLAYFVYCVDVFISSTAKTNKLRRLLRFD